MKKLFLVLIALFLIFSCKWFTTANVAATVVLTFDDGFENLYTKALPLMQKYSLTGTAFVITNRIGNSSFLSWEQIADLQEREWEIGSHSVSHPDLANSSYIKI